MGYRQATGVVVSVLVDYSKLEMSSKARSKTRLSGSRAKAGIRYSSNKTAIHKKERTVCPLFIKT